MLALQVEDLRDQMMLKGIPVHYPASEEHLQLRRGALGGLVRRRGFGQSRVGTPEPFAPL